MIHKNFLAIDTSTNTGIVLIYKNGKIFARLQQEPREHNRFLLAMIKELLSEAALELAALDALVCCVGPGSFVGVRLGVAVTQGLAYALQKPVYPVSALALQAQAFFKKFPEYSQVFIIQDARMQAGYLGHYQNIKGVATLIAEEQLIPLTAEGMNFLEANIPIAGTAAKLCCAALQEDTNFKIIDTPLLLEAETLRLQALHSLNEGQALSAFTLQPVYLNDAAHWQKS
jgi:tRNA threonylcarbamoyladenosine biosynthesis protein TsaB